jgi:hypothetical protein
LQPPALCFHLADDLAVLIFLATAFLGTKTTGATTIPILKSEPVECILCHNLTSLSFGIDIITYKSKKVKFIFRRHTSKNKRSVFTPRFYGSDFNPYPTIITHVVPHVELPFLCDISIISQYIQKVNPHN